MRPKLKRWFHNTRLYQWWQCTAKECDYYTHYLAYGPAELTHEGYHSAARICDRWQQLSMKWWEEHPNSTGPDPYEQMCERWEKAVRA
jgi:hypothetical protein